MIESCKYCLKTRSLCPRCTGPVITRTITEHVPVLGYVSTSVILCLTPECENYGSFKIQTQASVVTTVCQDCRKRNENMKRFQSELERVFKLSSEPVEETN